MSGNSSFRSFQTYNRLAAGCGKLSSPGQTGNDGLMSQTLRHSWEEGKASPVSNCQLLQKRLPRKEFALCNGAGKVQVNTAKEYRADCRNQRQGSNVLRAACWPHCTTGGITAALVAPGSSTENNFSLTMFLTYRNFVWKSPIPHLTGLFHLIPAGEIWGYLQVGLG